MCRPFQLHLSEGAISQASLIFVRPSNSKTKNILNEYTVLSCITLHLILITFHVVCPGYTYASVESSSVPLAWPPIPPKSVPLDPPQCVAYNSASTLDSFDCNSYQLVSNPVYVFMYCTMLG